MLRRDASLTSGRRAALSAHRYPLAVYQSAVRRSPSRRLTCGANPNSFTAREISKARALRKKSMRRRNSGGSILSGKLLFARGLPLSQMGFVEIGSNLGTV